MDLTTIFASVQSCQCVRIAPSRLFRCRVRPVIQQPARKRVNLGQESFERYAHSGTLAAQQPRECQLWRGQLRQTAEQINRLLARTWRSHAPNRQLKGRHFETIIDHSLILQKHYATDSKNNPTSPSAGSHADTIFCNNLRNRNRITFFYRPPTILHIPSSRRHPHAIARYINTAAYASSVPVGI